MANRAGYEKRNMSGEAAYSSFVPKPLPPDPLPELDSDTLAALIRANRKLAALEGISSHIPNMPLFVSMYVRKEALMSSQIEGTQATLEDVFDPMLEANTNRNVSDVVNYIRATDYAVNRLKTLPLCNRLLRETHAVLMEGVRGQEKYPGEFRRSQNWIGGQGSTLKTARYIPSSPEDMEIAMSDLEKYIHTEDGQDDLVRAALIHYQFETIHPFLDGNGRVGRLLITLYLMDRKLLSSPSLYISYFLKRNRVEYYDRMTEVRRSGNYEQWIYFFLLAVEECTQDAIETIDKLTALHEKDHTIVSSMGRAAKNTALVFSFLEANPIIDIGKTAQALKLSFNTVSASVRRLSEVGILTQIDAVNRNRTFAYESYLNTVIDVFVHMSKDLTHSG